MNREYFSLIFLFIANLLGLFYILPKLNNVLFLFEFVVFVFFMLLFVITIYSFYFDLSNKYILNTIFFVFGLINTIFLYFNIKTLMLVLLTAANAFGIVISVNSIEVKKAKHIEKEPKLVVEEIKPEVRKKDEEKIISEVKKELEEYQREKEVNEYEKEADLLSKAEKKLSEIKKRYTPGKFIASATSNKYHSPKCDWAKRIKKENRVWFKTEQEARRKGYSKHSCLKK